MIRPDLLGPLSRNNAQIVENAFEEEQPAYAIESLKIAFQMGMYPTKDLFLAILSIIVSSEDLFENNNKKKQKYSSTSSSSQNETSVRKYQKFQWEDVERKTIISTIDLVEDLIKTAPNAIRRYLPPFSDVERNQDSQNDFTQENDIEWQKEERNWLRRMLYIDGRSSPEDSRVRSRNRTPMMIDNPIIRLAAKMLNCNDIFDLFALNPNAKDDNHLNGGKMNAFNGNSNNRKRTKISREGDDEESKDANDAELVEMYDRPGTWILLKLLTSLWSAELESISEGGDGTKAKRAQSSHLALQVLDNHSKTFHSGMRGKAGDTMVITELGRALDLIKVGLKPSMNATILTSKRGDFSRRNKCLAAGGLLELFIQLGSIGAIDKQSLIRGVSSMMETMDSFAFERLEEMNLFIMKNTILARSAIRYLERSSDDDDDDDYSASPWDEKTKEVLDACLKMSKWNHHERDFLRLFNQGNWMIHKTDWEFQEGLEIFRFIKGLPSDQQDGVRHLLSQPSWQLFNQKPSKGKSKENEFKSNYRDKNVFIIAAIIKYRVIDQIMTQIQMQNSICDCLEKFFISTNDENQNLSTVYGNILDRHKKQIRKDISAIRTCLAGMQNYHKKYLNKDFRKMENGDGMSMRKRRRVENGRDDGEGEDREVERRGKAEISKFVRQWMQIERKIERIMLILEAQSMSNKNVEIDAIELSSSSSSSDLTELSPYL